MEDNEASRLRAFAEILAEFDLDVLRVRSGDAEYELVRREEQSSLPAAYVLPPGTSAAVNGVPALAAAAGVPSHALKITAPVVGVFYRSATPGAEPFVSVGDRVAVGQALCILEAMKLMNEITSDFAGIVTRILPENGELVRLNEELFWIEP
ncbi:MAG: biotin/lipoyl-containing protein [Candidatus Velthaea sp.]|jgi:acetyl-CoA carboxylase biotin carboxyl carrier protein